MLQNIQLLCKIAVLLAAFFAVSMFSANAQDAAQRVKTESDEKGYAIAARSDASDSGFGSSEVTATMILRNAAGQETERKMSFRTLERENENVGDKSLVIFETPRDVSGTALLSHAKILESDDQWLYIPAIARVKRISSANKSGPFVGSEFAFEDFTSTELNKYAYKYIGEDQIDGFVVDVVERYPLYEKSGYTRHVSYVDREIYQLRRVEFYDRKDALLKTLNLTDYRDYNGVWRAQKLSMTNHQTKKETDLLYGEFDFSSDLSDSDFVKGVLNRIR